MLLLFLISPRECVLISIVKHVHNNRFSTLSFLIYLSDNIKSTPWMLVPLMGFLAGLSKLANKKM